MLSCSVSCLADIPVFPTITATVTFQEFRYDEFEESIFFIPAEYKEDPCHFPDLWTVDISDRKRKWLAGCFFLGGGGEGAKLRTFEMSYSIYVSCLRKKRKKKGEEGDWSCWSHIVHSADVSKAKQCKKILLSTIRYIYRWVFAVIFMKWVMAAVLYCESCQVTQLIHLIDYFNIYSI